MTRRPLGETLFEVMADVVTAVSAAPSVTLRSVAITLPIELALRHANGVWDVLGDVPRTVTRTAFDWQPGRLEVLWVPGDQV
jgi:hypothetical protein